MMDELSAYYAENILMREGWHAAPDPWPIPAVYAIYSNGHLVYIGSTRNLAKRLGSHEILRQLRGLTVSVKARYTRDYWTREARLIRRLRPALNRAGTRQ